MFINKHTNAPAAKEQRHVDRFVSRANGAEDRVAAARDKRARKAEKRADDAEKAEIGQLNAIERLNGTHQRFGRIRQLFIEPFAEYVAGEKGTLTIGDHVYTGVEMISHTVEPA